MTTIATNDQTTPTDDGQELSREADIRRQAARLLGQARTEAKARAARENGKRGGWPKGRPLSVETRRKISQTRRGQAARGANSSGS